MNKQNYLNRICDSELFVGAHRQNLIDLLESRECSVESFENGQEIEVSRKLSFVLSGGVRIYSRDSGRNLLLKTVGKDGMLGVAGVFCTKENISRLFAKGKTELLVFGKDCIEKLIATDSAVTKNYLTFLANRIDYLNGKITIVTAGSVERKLALYLCSLGQDNINLPVSFSTLCDMLDVGRASLYRALDTLVADGCIEREGSFVKILDNNKLLNY